VYRKIAAGVADCAVRRVAVDDGVELQIAGWTREAGVAAEPIFFVAGWVSVVEGWAPLLEVLAGRRHVVYVETREKRSATFSRQRLTPRDFSLDRLAADLVAVREALSVEPGRAVLFGSSMGANAILEALKHERLSARAAFLIGPNSEFDFRWWGRLLVRMPASSYHLIKHFILWYLKHFKIREPDQMRRYERTLRAAHAVRIKLSAVAVMDYRVWPGLDTITTPVAIASASSDTLHGEDDIRGIVAGLPRARAVSCPSNQYMHSAEVASDLEEFLATLPSAPR